MNIDQVYDLFEGSFDGMVDFSACHDMPELVTYEREGDTFKLWFADSSGNKFAATLGVRLEVG